MAGSSASLHEDPAALDAALVDRHRAIVSLMEELEAVDWYDQRAAATADAELAEVLRHNRDEEKEHAVMTLEWLRRRDPVLDRHLRTYLFTEGSILAVEEADTAGGGAGAGAGAGADAEGGSPAPGADAGGGGSLGIGSLRDADDLRSDEEAT